MTVKLTVAVGGLMAVAALYGAGAASADTEIWVGGNTDCTSELYMNAGANPVPGSNNVPVVYGTCDGDFAPFMGSTRAPDAIQQGVDGTRAAWDANCSAGQRCTLHGFSIGAAPAAIVGTDVGADGLGGSNTHVITEGNAWGQLGVFGDKPGIVGVGINIGAPFAGVPLNIAQVPGSENRFNVNDGFADDATQPPWAEITDLSLLNGADFNGDGVQEIPPQHFIQTGEPVATFTTSDGVQQKVYGDPLPGVIAPQNNPLVNPELAPEPVRSDTPSFFGELPCPDGKFTPDIQPC